MKTTEPKTNRIKNNSKYLLTFLLSALFTINIAAKIDKDCDSLNNSMSEEQYILEKLIFAKVEDSSNEILDINDIEVIELEEEVELGFDTTKHLPENFNALKGKHDLDWNTIELIEIEEEVELGFDTSKYLPNGFDPYKGMIKNAVEVVVNQ
ncbi:MAG: hypothetical protein DRI75_11095 [Bacteroidetes bacterium]|nr:MAG: hypothetical protein DRI75_11095 [Bacteroidota bacterium]